jgi:hypothetical protein
MALVTVPGGLWWPEPYPSQTGYVSLGDGVLLDASGEKLAMVFRAPKTGTLDRFEFLLGTVTQAPASGLKCSFQNVDLATGLPDETVDENATVTSGLTTGAWVNPGSFSAGRAVTRGDLVAAVVEFAAWAAGDALALDRLYLSITVAPIHTSYGPKKLGGTWDKADQPLPPWALRYTDGSYALLPGGFPVSAIVNGAFNSGSSPDELGMRFTVPFPCRLQGVLLRMIPAASSTFDVVLYQDSTVVETVTTDGDVTYTAAARPILVLFDSLLVANTLYRVVLKPTATSQDLFRFTVANAAIMDAFGGGQAWHQTERTDAGAWTDTTTKRPWMSLWLSQVDAGGETVPISTFSSGTTGQTSGGAETDIATINVAGLYRLKLDLQLLADGDVIHLRRYMIAKTGGTTRKAGFMGFYGAQPVEQLNVGSNEWWGDDLNDLTDTDALQYTIEQPFGTTRALPFAVVKVA